MRKIVINGCTLYLEPDEETMDRFDNIAMNGVRTFVSANVGRRDKAEQSQQEGVGSEIQEPK